MTAVVRPRHTAGLRSCRTLLAGVCRLALVLAALLAAGRSTVSAQAICQPLNGGVGAVWINETNQIYSLSLRTGKAKLVTTSGLLTEANSLAFDSDRQLLYYTNNSVVDYGLYAYDVVNDTHIVIDTDLTNNGVVVGPQGVGTAAGGFDQGGTLYLGVEEWDGVNDRIYRINLDGTGTSVVSTSVFNTVAGDWGDVQVRITASSRVYSMDTGGGALNVYDGFGSFVTSNFLTGLGQAATDRFGRLWGISSTAQEIDTNTLTWTGPLLNITLNGSTPLPLPAYDAGGCVPATGQLGDRIWQDSDGDGFQDGGEPGIAGVTVALYDDVDADGVIDGGTDALLGVDTTDASGNYTFASVLPGDYIVDVTDVDGVLSGMTLVTTNQSGPDPRSVSMPVATIDTSVDFGYWAAADLQVTKTGPALASVGDTLTYTVEVINAGSLASTSVVITDTLPSVGSFVSASGGGVESAGIVTWPTIATMNPGDTVTYSVLFEVTGGSSLVNAAAATSATTDGAPGDEHDTVVTTVIAGSGSTAVCAPFDGSLGALWGVSGNRFYSINLTTGRASLVTTSTLVGTANSAAWDPQNQLLYYTNESATDYGLYAYDVVSGTHVVIDSNLTSHGVFVGPTGVGFAGAGFDIGGSAIYLGVQTWDGFNDRIYRVSLAANGLSVTGSSVYTNMPFTVDWGDIVSPITSDSRLYSFDLLGYVDIFNAAGIPIGGSSFVGVGEAGADRAGEIWNLTTSAQQIDKLTGNLTGFPVPITVDGSTPLGLLNDGAGCVPATSGISDFVWWDNDGDGVQDAGEPGAVGVTLTLHDDVNGNGAVDVGEGLLATDTTDAAGLYRFSNLLPGDYVVTVTDADGVLAGATLITIGSSGPSPRAVTLGTADAREDVDFGYQGAGTDLQIVKTAPDTVYAGDTITYNVEVVNVGPNSAADVVVTDTLPGTGTFVSASDSGVESSGIVTWPTIGSMAVNDTVTYTVTFVAPGTGVITNLAAVASATSDTDASNDTSSVATTVTELADLQVTKSGSASVNAGDTITYTVEVVNLGASSSTSVVIADTLPATGTFVSASDSGVESSGVVTWPTIGTLAANDTVTYTVTFVAPASGPITNLATVKAATDDPTATNDSSSVVTSITEQADLEVTKTGPASVNAGDTITYTVEVVNLGLSDAASVVVTDTLPGTGTFVSASDSGVESAGVVTWPTIGTLAANDTVAYTVTFVAPASGSITNVSAVTSATADPDGSNNMSSVVTSITEQADLEVTKTGPASVNAGDTIAYTVEVVNLGLSDATSVVITDTLPSTGTFVSASDSGVESSGVVTWPTIGTVAANDTVTYTVTFVAPASGAITNVSAATAATADPDGTNNVSSVVTSITEQADLEVTKTGPASVNAGDTITYTVEVVNLGLSDAASVVITDTLPSTGTFVSASDSGVESAGVVTWPTIGTLAANDTVTHTVTFVAPASGSITNVSAATSATADPDGSNNTSSVVNSVTEQADLEVTKTGPASVNAGDTITYTVEVVNLGISDAASVVITDTLPGTGTFVSASDSGVESAGVVTWPTIGTVAANDTVTYTVTFVAPASGSITNVSAATSATTDPDGSNNTSSVVTSITEQADLEVTKIGPASVNAGDTITYTVEVVNFGLSDAASVVVTDTLPSTGTFVGASDSGVESAGVVTWPTIGTLAANDTVTYTVTFVAPVSGSITNVSAVTAATADPDGSNNVSSVVTSVTEQADLEVTKTGPASVNAGDTITYTVEVVNLGLSDAASVVVTDTLPGTGTFISASDSGVESAGVVTWPTIGAVAANDTVTYTVTFVAPASGSITNVSAATAATADPDGTNNVSSVVTSITEQADLEVTKTGPASVNAGDTITYTVEVVNFGLSDAASVVITDTLPSAGTFVSASDSGVESAGVVTWPTIGTLAASDTVTYTVTFVAPASGSITNVAAVTAATTDPDGSNNTSSVVTSVTAQADLEVTKSGPASVNAGDTITYTVEVVNLGLSDAASVVITDTLPSTGTFVSASDSGVESAGVVTWPTMGALAANDTVTYTVTFIAPASGSITNVSAVTSATADPDGTNNTSSVVTSVTEQADLEVTKTGPVSVNAGDTITYTVEVVNLGLSDAASVVVTDTLPGTGTFISASDSGVESAGVVTWPTIGTVAANDTVTYTVTFVAPASGSITNVSAVTSATADPDGTNNTSSVVTSVTEQADLEVTKTGPASVNAGDTIIYTVEVVNLGLSDATSVVITDTLPSTGTFVSASDSGVESSGVVTWPTIGTVAANDTVTYTVTFIAPASGSITNVSAVTSATADPDGSNNMSSVVTSITEQADLAVTKTGPSSVNAGDTITYTVEVVNLGLSDAASVVITDTLPSTGTFVSASDSGVESAGVVTWPTIGTLAASDTVTYTVTFVAPASGSITNVAAVTSATTDPDGSNNTSSVVTSVTEQADLEVTKTGPASVSAGDTITYTVEVVNLGISDAASVVITDTLPGTGTFVSASDSGVESAGVVTWPTIGTLAASDTVTYTVTFVAPASGSITNVAAVTAATADPNGTNNTSSAVTSITEQADLEVTKTGPASVNAGDTITYTVEVVNLGLSEATSVVVTDTLPSTGTFVSASDSGVESAGVVTWPTIGTLAASDTVTYTVTFVAPATGSITNVSAVMSATTDPDGSNNTSSVVTSVTEQADLEVTKTGPASVNAGDTIIYTVEVVNLGLSDAESVVVTDTLPGTGTFVSASDSGVESAGVVTWPTIGTVAANDTVTYTVTFVAPASGSITNVSAVTSATADPDGSNNTSSVVTSVTEQADLEVTKTGPATASAGDTIVYTVEVVNLGLSDAASVVVTDTLPSTGTFVSASDSGVESAGVVTWPTIGTLAANDTVAYTVTFVAPASGSITNVSAVTSATMDPDGTNNTSSVVTSITEQADLEVTKTGPASVNAGDTITYTVEVVNLGLSDAASVVVTDTLPGTGTFVSASDSGVESAGVVTWPTIGTLAANDTVAYTVRFVAPTSGSITNVSAVTSATADPDGSNNTSSVTTSITEQADLEVTKTGPASVNAGDTITYTVEVVNLGLSDAASVVITDTLPSTGTLVSASDSGVESAGVVTWPTIGTLAASDTVTYTVTFVAPATGSITNVSAVMSATTDPDGSNNTSSAVTSITEQANLEVTKTGPATASAGDTIVYTVEVVNLGLSDAASVVVTDTLPGTGTFVSASDSGVESAGVVTWPTIGTLAANDTVAYTVRFVAPTSGSITNVSAVTSATADPDGTNNTSSVVTSITEQADLEVTKIGPASVNAGDTITYTVEVVNLGLSDAASVVITDTLPSTGTFVSASDSGVESAGVVTWPTIGTVAANDTVTYTVRFVAPASGSITNVSAVTSATADPDGTNNTSSVVTSITEQADLEVTKIGPASVNAGDTITYTVEVVNLGLSDAASVVITDTLPSTGTFVSASDSGVESAGVVTWPTIGTLAANDTVAYTVRFVAPASGSITNVSAVTSATADPDGSNNMSSVVTSITEQADLEVTKTGPASVNAGDTIIYTVEVVNLGLSDATSVVITDTLPSTGTFVSASDSGVESSGVVTWPTIGTVAANDTVTYTVTFVAPASGSITNVSAVTSATTDPDGSNNTSSVVTSVTEQADLEVTKIGPASVNAGDTITYTVEVVNLGLSDAASVVITDTLPGTGAFVGASDSGVESAGVVTWPTIGTLAANDTVTYTVTFVAPASGSITNVSAVTSATADPDGTNNTSSVVTSITEQADLEVTKTGPASVNAGDTIIYTVEVVNVGPSDAASIVITDTLPGTGTFVSASDSGVESAGVVTWPTIGTVAANDTVAYTVTFVAPASGSITNVSAVTSATADPDGSNNTSSVVTSITEQADLEVTKTGPSSVNAGDTITYTVEVVNLGLSDATSVVVTDTLPSTGTFVSASDSGVESAGVVTWPTIGTLLANDTVTYTVTFVAPASGSITNVSAVTSATTDPGGSNNVSSAVTNVTEQADLEVTKTGPASVNAGDTITYTVEVVNLGLSDAASVLVTDTLPSTGTFVGASDSGVESAGVVTWPTIGTLAANDTVTYTVTFVAPASGSITNVAAVTSATADPDGSNSTASVATSVTGQADLAVTKTGPASASAGDTITYTVEVVNFGLSDATSVVITDTLPSTGAFVSASDSGVESAGVVTWPTIGTLAANDTVTHTVTFIAPASGSITNVSAVTSATADPDGTNNTSSVVTSITEQADLEVTKTGPASANAGDTITYTVEVVNLGLSDAASVVITDTLPSTGTFVGASDSGVESAGVVTWPTIGTLAANDTVTYTVTFVVPATGSITNVAAVTSATTDPDGSNSTASVTTSVTGQADLEVTKTGPASVNAGDTITYTVEVVNFGLSDAASVVITDTLPSTGTFVGASDSGVESAGVVTWPTIGTLAANDTVTYTVTFVAPASGSITNVAAVTSATADPDGTNSTSSVTTSVTGQADLAVTKTGPASANAGDTITYTVEVVNFGLSDAASVVITDTLPSTGTFVGASDSGVESAGVVTWPTIGTLAANDTVTYTVTFVAPASGSITNVSAATSATTDPDGSNNVSSVVTSVTEQADLEVTKTGPASVNAGDTITYTVEVVNLGLSDAASVVVTDTLPGTGTFVSASDSGVESAGVVTWPTISTLAANDTVTYTVTFVAPASGSITNVAAVTSATTDPDGTNSTSSVVTSITEQADLEVTKIGPASVNAGDTITYTVEVVNLGLSDAASVVVTDTLPGMGTFISASDSGAESSGVVTWPTIGTLAANDTVTYTVTFVAPASGSITNVSAVTSATTDPDGSNNVSSVVTNVTEQADLEVTKTGPASVNAGDTITYTVEVVNLGLSDATSVVVTDTLPGAGTFVSASDSGVESAGVVTWPTIGTLAANDTVTYTVTFVAPATGSITNVAAVTSATTDPDGSNGTASVTTSVTGQADLAVTKTGPASVNAGDTITYTVQVVNFGLSDAASVVITDTLPSTGTFASASDSGVESSGVVTWPTIGTLAANDTVTYTVTFVAPASGSITNVAAVTSAIADPDGSNNTSSVVTSVTEQADLEVTKTGPASANAGDTITYTVEVVNFGLSDAASVVITDTLPSTGTFVSASDSGVESAGVVTWPTIGTLAANDTVTYMVTFVAPASGSITNVSAVTAATADPDGSNNTSSVVTSITEQADLEVTKTGPATASAGDTITYTVEVVNLGLSDATSVVVTDTLPVTGTFVSASDSGVESAGVVTWPTIGTLAANDTVTYTVTFVAPASGSITNVAAVTSATADPDGTNSTSSVTTSVTEQADLEVTKTGPASANAGDTITYTVEVVNFGLSDAASVVITDTLPGTGTFVSASDSGVESAGVVTWPTIGTLAANDTVTYTVTFVAPASGSITNVAAVTAATTDPDGTNSTSSITTSVTGQADLAITKTGPASANAGDTITYTVEVVNLGLSDAASVVVTDTLPSTGTFVSATDSGVESAGVVTWPTIGTLAANDTVTYTVTFVAPASGSITNVAAASSGTSDPDPGNNVSSVSTSVTPGADLQIAKTGPALALAGDTITYTVEVVNLGLSDASSVVVTDTLPSTGTFVSASGGGALANGVVTWPVLATLAANDTVTHTVVFVAPGTGSLTNLAAVSGATGDPDTTNNVSSLTTGISSQADVLVRKSGPATASAGDTITYVVTVLNQGPSDAVNVVATDVLPAAGTFVSASAGGDTLSSGVVTWPAIPTLAAADSVSYALTFIVPNSGTITNVAAASSPTADPNATNNDGTNAEAGVTTTVVESADIHVRKAGPATASAGDTVTYTISVTNSGPSSAADVTVSDTLPALGQFIAASAGGDTTAAGVVTWPAVPSIAAGDSVVFTVSVQMPPSGSLVNLAAATSSTGDPDSTNNDGSSPDAQVVTTIDALADLAIAKSGPATVAVGDTVTYTLTVTNLGPSTARQVAVTDSLPAGFTFVAASNGGSHSGGVVTWPLVDSLAVSGTVSYTLRAIPGGAGASVNVGRVESATQDSDPNNDRSTASVDVTAAPDLSISKVHVGALNEGQSGLYRIEVINVGAAPTTGVVTVTDTLPSGLTFQSGSGVDWTVTASGSEVVATRTLPLAVGDTATFDVSVDVGSNLGGQIVNVARVSTPGDGFAGNDLDADTAAVSAIDIALDKIAVGSFMVGDTVSYQMTVDNVGGIPTTGPITVVDTLPAGLTFVSGQGVGWTVSADGSVVTAVYPAVIASPGSAAFTLQVLVGPEAVPAVTNHAVASTAGDSDPANNAAATPAVTVAPSSVLVVEKRASRPDVEMGETIEYGLTVRVVGSAPVPDVQVDDVLPQGFRFVPGSATIDGASVTDPSGSPGPTLTFDLGTIDANGTVLVTYRTRVGPGADLGDGINRARARSVTAGVESGEAVARVLFRAGVFADEGTIVGKVFLDCACSPGEQTGEEIGVPGVVVYLQDGTSAVTDSEGKYHFLGLSPRTYVVSVDPRSLPRGARLIPLSNRHAGVGGSAFVDLKKGELHRADFADGSGSVAVFDQVVERRRNGEVEQQGLTFSPDAGRSQTLQTRDHRGSHYRSLAEEQRIVTPAPEGVAIWQPDRAAAGETSDQVVIDLPRTAFVADGETEIPIRVHVPSEASLPNGHVTMESSSGRWLVEDADPSSPGLQVPVADGRAEAVLLAPDVPASGSIRVTAGDRHERSERIDFTSSIRSLVLAGLLEARIDGRSLADSEFGLGRGRDAFEDALESVMADGDDGRLRAGARATLFAQGALGDGYGLTLRLDTEEDERSRLFRDFRPEELYPLYGDASLQRFDAQSKGRFFARVDKGPSYALFGDFNTGFGSVHGAGGRALGTYNRTLNGALEHFESERALLRGFASRDRFVQIVDEIRGLGISGPYALSRADGLINSERVELVTRDRNQPALILRVQRLERYVDYTMEPFSGRLVFKRPVPSVDASLNPVTIRVSYEVESGGDPFWVLGLNGRVKPVDGLELGGTIVRDENPGQTFDLYAVDATVGLGRGTFLTGEFARTDSASTSTGDAFRLELSHSSDRVSASAYFLDADVDFRNPSSAFGSGRRELGGRLTARLANKTRVFGEALRTEDRTTSGRRVGATVGVERDLGAWMRARLGLRYASETTTPATTQSGPTPNDVLALSAGINARLPWLEGGSVFAEYEQDVAEAKQRRAAIGADYRLFDRARLYARHELLSSFSGPYGLNSDQERTTTVFGVAADYLAGQSIFSEYRSRDAFGGREAQAAIGLRNRWQLDSGVRLSSSFERLSPLSEGGSTATAITGAFEYTANPLWKGSARLEYRAADSGDNVLGSLGYARKLNRDWSLLGTSLFSSFVESDRAYARTRLGLAYRQTDRNRWNALARYEHRYDRNPDFTNLETTRSAHVLSAHVNTLLAPELLVRAQWASKWASETSPDFTSDETAHLLALRGTYDLTDRLDVGLIGRALLGGNALDRVQYGAGAEVGLLLRDNLRLSGGYNLFGFRDDELVADEYSEHGFYFQLGFKFDQSLFGLGPEVTEQPAFSDVAGRTNRGTDLRSIVPVAVDRDTLATPDARISDRVVGADLAVLDQWEARLRALEAGDQVTPAERYRVARARALLDIARQEYEENDRTPFPAALVVEVADLVKGREDLSGRTAVSGSAEVAPEIWDRIDEIKASPSFACVAEDVARLEAQLLWAGNEHMTCAVDDPRPHLEKARELADALEAAARSCEGDRPAAPGPGDSVSAPSADRDTVADTVMVPDSTEPRTAPDTAAAADSTMRVEGSDASVPNVVHFAFDRAELDERSKIVLDSVVAVLSVRPEATAVIVGHTDTRGSPAYNRDLAMRRAEAVRTYLANAGVVAERMSAESLGETTNHVTARNEMDHARNRRVTIVLTVSAGGEIRVHRQERDLKPLGRGQPR